MALHDSLHDLSAGALFYQFGNGTRNQIRSNYSFNDPVWRYYITALSQYKVFLKEYLVAASKATTAAFKGQLGEKLLGVILLKVAEKLQGAAITYM